MNQTKRMTSTKGPASMLTNMLTSRALLAALTLAILCALSSASSAKAEFGIADFSVDFHDPTGATVTQAAGHPDMTVEVDLNTEINPETGKAFDSGQLKSTKVVLPPGFYGNPQAVPTCPRERFFGDTGFTCPSDTRIGTFTLGIAGNLASLPLYNVKPGPEEAAVFGATVVTVPINIVSTVGGDGKPVIQVFMHDISQGVGFQQVRLDFWGVPADPVHDAERGGTSGTLVRPLLTAPSDCGTPLVTSLQSRFWQDPSVLFEDTDTEEAPTGCEKLQFDPTLSLRPAGNLANSPDAYDIELDVPQDEAPSGLGTPPLRRVAVKLPEGVGLSPPAAAGLSSCSDDALGLGTGAAPACPPESKIGTVSVDTPLLADPLAGSIYLGTPTKDNLARPFLVLKGPGVLLKLPGTVHPDPDTGQLTAVFDDLPQLPFSHMHMRFKGGPRAPLTTPKGCGPHTTEVTFTSWSGQVANGSSSFDTGGGNCGGKFSPQLTAGSVNPVAGATSPFVLRLERGDGDGFFKDLTVHLPEGLSAYLKGVPYCPDAALGSISGDWGTGAAQVGNPSCPAASKIGSVTVGAGAGASPFYLDTGKAYLAGPYKGAPLSLAIVAPAVAGPFDLGNVTVRTALHVNPTTAEITAVSDRLPSILQGVPLQLRDIQVNLDRPDFTVNPTSCKPMAVTAELESTEGQTAGASDHYQVANCADLGFKPKLSLKFTGATHRSAHPALRAVLKARQGDANIGKAVVTLPKTEFLENAHIRTVCTRVQYAADKCPKDSVYGYAKAWTPLLAKPLQGPVYLRSSNHTLPDLVASLDGQIHIDLAGRIDSPGGKIRNTFWALPDAPVSKFVLTMQGGKKGLLVNNTELCAVNPRAKAEFTGQNGKRSASRLLVKLGCGKSPQKR